VSGGRGDDRGHMAMLSLGALGVVYGDIGTSPLYAFREALHVAGSDARPEHVLGILSMILWSLMLVVTWKYLALVMRADNHGEGGVLALTSLLLPSGGDPHRRRGGLILLGLAGTALLYGDGVITPAISVLAAVEGLEVAAPDLGPFVVPLAVAILVGLFAMQHLGTASIGAIFGPVMATWFTTLGVLGLVNLVRAPEVLAAVSPAHALALAVREPGLAFLALGGVFLVVTGTEALYADMGHFGRRPIQLGWYSLVLPALLLNYFGQGALLLDQPELAASPFFRMAPAWALLPLVGLATMATVIASQALVSGAFSVTMQAVQLGFLPRVRIDHTSAREFGQVYLPMVNLALMVGSITLVLGFRSSTNLAAAYGIAVAATMLITTLLLAAVARERWSWSRRRTMLVVGPFLALDLVFFSANVVKIPAGGWLPLVVAAVLVTIMTTWHAGRRHVTRRRRLGAMPLHELATTLEREPLPRVAGTAVYLAADADQVPGALEANLATHHVLHEEVHVVSVLITDLARQPESERVRVQELGQGLRLVLLRFGLMEEPAVPAALEEALPPPLRPGLEDAVYFVGRETIVATEIPGMALWRERLFTLLHRNASSVVRYFDLPRDRIIVLGAIIEI
jgi:KUP system potassium uptake protein